MTDNTNIERRKAVRRILANRGETLVVCGLGSSTYDVFAAGDDDRNFYLWGAMGGAVMIGLGLAIARDLAVAQGGALKLTRSTEDGSEFRLQLPMEMFTGDD